MSLYEADDDVIRRVQANKVAIEIRPCLFLSSYLTKAELLRCFSRHTPPRMRSLSIQAAYVGQWSEVESMIEYQTNHGELPASPYRIHLPPRKPVYPPFLGDTSNSLSSVVFTPQIEYPGMRQGLLAALRSHNDGRQLLGKTRIKFRIPRRRLAAGESDEEVN